MRKLIDIDSDVAIKLKCMAAVKNKDFKNFIQDELTEISKENLETYAKKHKNGKSTEKERSKKR